MHNKRLVLILFAVFLTALFWIFADVLIVNHRKSEKQDAAGTEHYHYRFGIYFSVLYLVAGLFQDEGKKEQNHFCSKNKATGRRKETHGSTIGFGGPGRRKEVSCPGIARWNRCIAVYCQDPFFGLDECGKR